MTTKYDLSDTVLEGWNVQQKLRYHAKRRGYALMTTLGDENRRRQQAGVGPYLLINTATDTVELSAATLADIADFLRHNDRAQRRQH